MLVLSVSGFSSARIRRDETVKKKKRRALYISVLPLHLKRKGDGELNIDPPTPCQQQAPSQTKPKGNGQLTRTQGPLANGFGGVFLPQPEGVVFLPPQPEGVFLPNKPEGGVPAPAGGPGVFLPQPEEGSCSCPSRRGGVPAAPAGGVVPAQAGGGGVPAPAGGGVFLPQPEGRSASSKRRWS